MGFVKKKKKANFEVKFSPVDLSGVAWNCMGVV